MEYKSRKGEEESKAAYWFVFHGDAWLLRRQPDGGYAVPFGCVPPVRIEEGQVVNSLPDIGGIPCHAVHINEPTVPEMCELVRLRASFHLVAKPFYLMAGKARELLHWDATTKFCSVCGTPLERHTEISKRCPRCGHEAWPLLSTAIIVLVKRGEEVLLVQGKHFQGDYLGLVSGFVETGETLEECVVREVREETQLCISNIHYFGSQPWPYPCGLMVGFYADYAGGTLRIQRSELNKGGWYRRDNLPAIPERLSMARMLLDAWMEGRLGDGRTDHGLPVLTPSDSVLGKGA